MTKIVRLKNGTRVVIRHMRKDDLDQSWLFFKKLPPEDREYLRTDVTKRSVVKKRLERMENGLVKRIVAMDNDRIVADGTLEVEGPGWKGHIGEIRLIVDRAYQRKGLGMLMARELYLLALRKQLEEIVVRIMAPQKSALSIFKRLGFRKQVVIQDYVKDQKGVKHDLIIMRCNIEELWKELEEYLAVSDWQRTR